MRKNSSITTNISLRKDTYDRFNRKGVKTGKTVRNGSTTTISTTESFSSSSFSGSRVIGIGKVIILLFLFLLVLRYLFSNGESSVISLKWFLDTIASPNLPYLDLSLITNGLIPSIADSWGSFDFVRLLLNFSVNGLNMALNVCYIIVAFVWNIFVGLQWIALSLLGV